MKNTFTERKDYDFNGELYQAEAEFKIFESSTTWKQKVTCQITLIGSTSEMENLGDIELWITEEGVSAASWAPTKDTYLWKYRGLGIAELECFTHFYQRCKDILGSFLQ